MSMDMSNNPLRDRIRRAICEAEGFAWDSDMLEPDEYGDVADLVLAALPDIAPATGQPDMLPAWLHQRFRSDRADWVGLTVDDQTYWEHEAAAVRRAVARGGFKASSAAPAICEIPHATVDEEDACERARLGVANAARAVFRRLRAHLAGFQDVLDDSDRGPWANTVGADLDELGALLDANPTAEETRNA